MNRAEVLAHLAAMRMPLTLRDVVTRVLGKSGFTHAARWVDGEPVQISVRQVEAGEMKTYLRAYVCDDGLGALRRIVLFPTDSEEPIVVTGPAWEAP